MCRRVTPYIVGWYAAVSHSISILTSWNNNIFSNLHLRPWGGSMEKHLRKQICHLGGWAYACGACPSSLESFPITTALPPCLQVIPDWRSVVSICCDANLVRYCDAAYHCIVGTSGTSAEGYLKNRFIAKSLIEAYRFRGKTKLTIK